jgi:hypothetical protein
MRRFIEERASSALLITCNGCKVTGGGEGVFVRARDDECMRVRRCRT